LVWKIFSSIALSSPNLKLLCLENIVYGKEHKKKKAGELNYEVQQERQFTARTEI